MAAKSFEGGPPDGIRVQPENPDELFELLEKIGSGGSDCIVYRARNRATGEILAVKIIPLGGIHRMDDLEPIKKEIEMLDQCDHPNIVTYRGTYWTTGALWVCMEHCAGGSVDKIFETLEHPLPEAVLAYICHEVLLGLKYLHEQRKIHRDVKGSNILITDSGGVKLADFGVSAQLLNTLSARNSSVGTLHWMAPEQLTGKDYDERVDVYSLGITLVELAEGKPPLFHYQQMRAIFEIPRQPAPTLSDTGHWTPQLHTFLARCVVKDPANRARVPELLGLAFIKEARNMAAELADTMRLVQRVRAEREQAAAKPPAMRAGPGSVVTDDDEDGSIAYDGGAGRPSGGDQSSITSPNNNARGGSADPPTDEDETVIQRGPAVAARGAGGAGAQSASPQQQQQQQARPRRAAQQPDRFLLDLDLVNLDDMAVDELTGDDGAPPYDRDACLYHPEPVPSVDRRKPLPPLTHATEVLVRCMHHHRTAAQQRVMREQERERHEALLRRYARIVHTSLEV